HPVISRDGRYVAFETNASLVPTDTGFQDIYLHDLVGGRTTRVSVSSSGAAANDHSYRPAISGNGRFVSFYSNASNLVPGGGTTFHVYVHDRLTGETTRASVSSDGVAGNNGSGSSALSDDGRYVAFNSMAS